MLVYIRSWEDQTRASVDFSDVRGCMDWGLGIGDWGLGPIPNPQIPNPQSPIPNEKEK